MLFYSLLEELFLCFSGAVDESLDTILVSLGYLTWIPWLILYDSIWPSIPLLKRLRNELCPIGSASYQLSKHVKDPEFRLVQSSDLFRRGESVWVACLLDPDALKVR